LGIGWEWHSIAVGGLDGGSLNEAQERGNQLPGVGGTSKKGRLWGGGDLEKKKSSHTKVWGQRF